MGSVPRLDLEKQLPRFEFVINGSNTEFEAMDWTQVVAHRDRLLSALIQNGFDVAAEHNMFDSKVKLDILPSLLIRVHDTVKHWAADLLSRVQEYVGHYIAKYVQFKRMRGIKIRPFTKAEIEVWYGSLKSERDSAAGATPKPTSEMDRVADGRESVAGAEPGGVSSDDGFKLPP